MLLKKPCRVSDMLPFLIRPSTRPWRLKRIYMRFHMNTMKKNHVRRYGFHGSSHRYVSGRCIELMGNPEHSKIIVCHLGAGGSLCAVKDGKSINTSMGLTPLAGIMMGSRCGEIDPSVVTFIMSETGETASRMDTIMNKESGLLGVSGVSSDYRDVEAAANEGNERAQIALKIFARRVADFIGSYYVQLGGVDAICFTAGIGENSFTARANIINEIKDALGVEIDEKPIVHANRIV